MALDIIPSSRARLENYPQLFSAAELTVAQLAMRQRCPGSSLPAGDVADPATRVSLVRMQASLRHVHNVLGDRMAPVVGAAVHLSTFGIPGFALMSSATLMDALVQARELWPLLNLRYDLQFGAAAGGRVRVTLIDRLGLDRDGQMIFALLEIARLVTLCRDLLGGDFDPSRIGAGGASPGERAALATMTRADIVPSDTVFLDIAAGALHAALPQANRATHGQIGAMCRHMLEELFGEPPLVRRIKARMAQLERGVPTLSDIAAMLCLSERTLRRRLHDLDTSYYRLLDEVRMEIAERCLRDDSVTTDWIAERLGYAEVSNFCHAFRRWTGSSPRHFRIPARA